MSGTIVFILRLSLALALYSFLGWTIYTLWRELHNQGDALVKRVVPRLSIIVRARGAEERRSFEKEEVTIGRDPGCDIHLMEETASVRHARLRYHHTQWWVEDLDSLNGSQLNKQLINTPTVLTSGDEISCGKTQMIVEIAVDDIGLPTRRIK